MRNGFWFFMLCMDLLLPVIMYFFGIYMKKGGPKSINGIVGYRTRRSMMNQDTWKFAHEHCGSLWVRYSLILGLLSIVVMIFTRGRSDDFVGNVGAIICYVQIGAMFLSIFQVERALRKNFDKDGNRKETKKEPGPH